MSLRKDLEQLAPFLYEVPTSYRQDMRAPGRIYADEGLLEAALADRSVDQLVNTTTLPGIVKYALAMPDIHQGYGFPIGGVVATRLSDGIISPGGVGYDINCGVRVLTSSIDADELESHMPRLMDALFRNVPTGVGRSGSISLSDREMHAVLEKGSWWTLSKGYATEADCAHTEDGGRMEHADPSAVSPRAMARGRDQLGTLGSGNHFLEVDRVAEIHDERLARAYGLRLNQVVVWIHCGSRGLGHQVCTDAVRDMQRALSRYNIRLPDRELACAPFESPEGRKYMAAMSSAANFAWANRQVITHLVRQTFEEVLGDILPNLHLPLLYDVCHNIAKVEQHKVDGERVKVCVHRKGATRAFGPGEPQVPEDYRAYGQPVLVPGDMGTGSYILAGTESAMRHTFGSSCHGAGRVISRSQARRTVRGEQLRVELEQGAIAVRAGSMAGLAEEAPVAYKDLERVVDVVHRSEIAKRVARTKPMGVIKG